MFAACLVAAVLGAEFDFEIHCKRDDDRIDLAADADRAVFTVASPRGIGAATVQRRRPAWPAVMVLRMRLRGLESLTIAADQVTLGVSVSSSPPHTARLHFSETGGIAGKNDRSQQPLLDRSSQSERRRQAGVRFAGPREVVSNCNCRAELLAKNPKAIEIRWIDFYRN